MSTPIIGCAHLGIEPHYVPIANGLPEIDRETQIRVRYALGTIGAADSSIPGVEPCGAGPGDLAVAIASLVQCGRIQATTVSGVAFVADLSLAGALRPVLGVLPRLRDARAAGFKSAIVAPANGAEALAAVGDDLPVFVAVDLAAIVAHFQDSIRLDHATAAQHCTPDQSLDLADVRGQPEAVLAIRRAAETGRSLLIIGPPGAGKTMLARRAAPLLPPLTHAEALQITAIRSVAGLIQPYAGLARARPFRAPHHTVSDAGLFGAGAPMRPGEVSLAHGGVLFLDELTEFRANAIDGLRRVRAVGVAEIARGGRRVAYQARFLLIGAANPCPCWRAVTCQCPPDSVTRYKTRLSTMAAELFDDTITIEPTKLESLVGAST